MLINAYYYAPHNHAMLDRHIREDLEHMVSLGTDVVSVCVQESQLTNWHQQRLRNFVDMAHAVGLQVHAVPNRWAGLFAGWLDGIGQWVLQNLDALIHGPDGQVPQSHNGVCCTQNPKVREHIVSTLELMFDRYDFDGVIWDEPRGGQACYCRHCRALNPEPTDEWQRRRMAEFLEDISSVVKSVRPDAVVSLFAQPPQKWLIHNLLGTKYIDYLGSDGHVRSQDHVMHRMKGTIFEAYENFSAIIKKAGHKTIFLPEGQRHRDEDLDNYLENLEKAFTFPMDQLLYYYSAHEMSPEKADIMTRATWDIVAKVKRMATQSSTSASSCGLLN